MSIIFTKDTLVNKNHWQCSTVAIYTIKAGWKCNCILNDKKQQETTTWFLIHLQMWPESRILDFFLCYIFGIQSGTLLDRNLLMKCVNFWMKTSMNARDKKSIWISTKHSRNHGKTCWLNWKKHANIVLMFAESNHIHSWFKIKFRSIMSLATWCESSSLCDHLVWNMDPL